jgi:hypothetical protein
MKHATMTGNTAILETTAGSGMTKEMQFSGMTGDPSLMRTTTGFMMLNDAGFLSPCSKPANMFVNDNYWGVYANTENPDEVFMARRGYTGGTLYKETWPLSNQTSYYENLAPIPGLSNAEIKSGPSNPAPFVNLTLEAEDCVRQGDAYCTNETASAILDKYVDAQSFIDGFVGLALSGNWDSVFYTDHNYLMYVTSDNKLTYVAWDLDQTGTGTITSFHPLQAGLGAMYSYPWYNWNLTARESTEAIKNGDFNSPSPDVLDPYYSQCMPPEWNYRLLTRPESVYMRGYSRTGHFACRAAANVLMGKAWKERFFETYNRVVDNT